MGGEMLAKFLAKLKMAGRVPEMAGGRGLAEVGDESLKKYFAQKAAEGNPMMDKLRGGLSGAGRIAARGLELGDNAMTKYPATTAGVSGGILGYGLGHAAGSDDQEEEELSPEEEEIEALLRRHSGRMGMR